MSQPDPTQVLSRQDALRLTLPTSVHVIGCGGVGAWIAMFLALARCPLLVLWDMDVVSESNLNRLPLGPDFIGEYKSIALAQFLTGLTNVQVISCLEWTDKAAKDLGYDHIGPADMNWLVAATDTWQSRKDIYAHALEHNLMYLEASAEGEWGGMTDCPATFATEDEVNPGYASVPVHVGPCVASAAMAAYYILHGVVPTGTNLRFGWDAQTKRVEFLVEYPKERGK